MKLLFFLTLAATLGYGPCAIAQVYPSRPITMIVPFPAGGPTDTIGRIIADGMRVWLGRPVIIAVSPSSVEALQDGRIHIEKINAPFLFVEKATAAEYKAGLDLAIARGWLKLHETGTYVRFTPAGADLFA